MTLYHVHYVILEGGYERGEDEYVRAAHRDQVERHAEAYLLREVFELAGDRLADAPGLTQGPKGYWYNPIGWQSPAKYDITPIDCVPVRDLTTGEVETERRVTRWVYTGELSSAVEGVGVSLTDVLLDAGRALGRNSAWEAVGDVLFQATDGQWYGLTVEAVISPADASYVRDSLAAADAEEVSDDQDG